MLKFLFFNHCYSLYILLCFPLLINRNNFYLFLIFEIYLKKKLLFIYFLLILSFRFKLSFIQFLNHQYLIKNYFKFHFIIIIDLVKLNFLNHFQFYQSIHFMIILQLYLINLHFHNPQPKFINHLYFNSLRYFYY